MEKGCFPAVFRGPESVFLTPLGATGKGVMVNVFGRPETTTHQSLTKTYRGC
jgi:hypothetical protein